MTVAVMQVTTKSRHPNADTLYVYNMTDGSKSYQIVANSENIYEIDDMAIVARTGSRLKDGLHIRREEIRGVKSYGMAVGKTDLPVGTDLTEEYCSAFYFVSWPDIELFYNVRKKSAAVGMVDYGLKIKLDGTCAAVQINGTAITAQSRTAIITPQDDNYGFAKWVADNNEYFTKIEKRIVIFGEWCGQGIQKRCSISKIGRKVFCVFAIMVDEDILDINPASIRAMLPEHKDIYVLPFDGFISIDYSNADQMAVSTQSLNDEVKRVEECDPYVKDTFGVSGLGEGLVLYPLPAGYNLSKPILIHADDYSDLVFKAKGEKHSVVKTKEPVQISPEKAASIDEFVTLFVTEPRLEQFASRFPLEMKETGNFLKAFCQDVLKESSAELEASAMVWSDVSSAISAGARKWWTDKVKAS